MSLTSKEEIKAFINANFKKVNLKKNDSEEISHRKRMIMYRFLSEIERISEERNLNQKQIANMIGVTPSYLTQLYRGSKVINLETIAKLEHVLKVTFSISAKSDEKTNFMEFVSENNFNVENSIKFNLVAQNVMAESGSVNESNKLQMIDLNDLLSNSTAQEYEEKYC